MNAPAWSARDDGRSENAWLCDIPWLDLGLLDVDELVRRHPRVIVVAPHPDDETLAVGGLLAELSAAGTQIDIMLLTDGEASHPRSPSLDRATVGRVRRAEFAAALECLGVDAHVIALGLPDGGVAANEDALADALRAELERGPALVVATWDEDGHADHDAAGRVARHVTDAAGMACVMYPLWAWHWSDATQFDWPSTVLVPLSVRALEAKRAAVASYASQTSTFGQPVAEPELLHPGVLRRFERVVETLVDPAGVLPRRADAAPDAAAFDAMFDESDDPWNVETSWYERRKQALTLAMAPDEHLGRVLDVGCSTGALTAALAARADSVIAFDQSERALAIARRRTGPGTERIDWRHGALPLALTDVTGRVDTVVISEVGYFLEGRDLLALFAQIERLLAPGGVVITANWQHPTRDIPLDGRLVDAQFRAVWTVTARYEDDDVAISAARTRDEKGEVDD